MASKKYRTPQTQFYDLTPIAIDYLTNVRKLSLETIKAFRLALNKSGEIVIPFYDEEDVLRLVKRRHVTGGLLHRRKVIDGQVDEYECKTDCESGGKPILLGSHLANPKNGPLIICFGDYDCMTLHTEGIENAVSPPYGDLSHQYIDLQWDFLNQFSEIILYPDIDKDPETARIAKEKLEELADRLGKYRCKVVKDKYRYDTKDANALYLKQGPGANQFVVNGAEFVAHKGVFRLAEYEEPKFTEGTPIGLPDIDKATGGISKGDLILIAGDNHAGKTTVALNIAAEFCEAGLPVFAWSGEQKPDRIRWWFEQIIVGEPYLTHEVSSRTGREYHRVKQEFVAPVRAWYYDKFFTYDQKGITSEEFFKTAELVVRRHGVELIIIDNLMAFTGGAGDAYLQEQGDFAQSCKAFAQTWNVPVILIVHNRKFEINRLANKDDVEGSKKVTSWADIIIQCNRLSPIQRKEVDVDAIYSLCKNRDTGEVVDVKIVFNPVSKRLAQSAYPEKLEKVYSWIEYIAETFEESEEIDF